MEWSNEYTIEFLNLYEKEGLIWNPKDPLHKNRNAVSDAWNRIKDQLSVNCSIQDLKKKKDSLMATFRPLSHKVKDSMRTGSAANNVFKPNWIFYEPMAKFLHGIYQPNVTINTEEFIDQDDISCSNHVAEENIEDDVILAESALPSPGSAVFKSPATKGMKRKNVIEDCMMDAYKIMKNVVEKPQKDDCSLYAELLARKLRTFDESTREILMHEIDELIFRTKCETRNRTVQSHLPPVQIGHQYPPSFNNNNYAIPLYNHNTSLSTLHSNMIHSINMSPAVSSFSPHASENSRISQPSPNLNPSNSSQSPETYFTRNLNHNTSLSPLHSNMIHSNNMSPAVSSFSPHSSENSRMSQPSPNLNPSNSSQSPDTYFTITEQNGSVEDNLFI